MNNRTDALLQRILPTIDTWRVREAEASSRALDHLLSRLRGALPATAASITGAVILFRESSTGLDARARASLRDRAAVLRTDPGIRIVIGGLASPLVGTAYGMGLALRRVQAIRAFLLSQGIGASRIEVGIRGTEWFLVERSGRWAEEKSSGECRLQVADSHWAQSRN